jgi:acetyl-CoA C-acetyltransferase
MTVMSDNDVVILGAARTPFGKFGGTLRDFSLPELSTIAASGALARAGVEASEVEEFALGVNLPGSDRSVARQAALRVGVPEESNSYSVDRACCSSLTATSLVSRAIRAGDVAIAMSGGAENLSRVPFFLENLRWGRGLGDVTLSDQLVISCPYTRVPRAVQAADEAEKFGLTREQLDEWALRSQRRYAEADARGAFSDERVHVPLSDGSLFTSDESARPDTTLERLGSLKTAYGSKSTTAGNAPGLSTGASSLVLASRAEAERRGAAPVAAIVATAMASGHPAGIASIPAIAARRVLDRAGLTLDDISLIEINEAFAAVPLVTTLVMADGDVAAAKRLRERVNVNGGAIAIGHPTGASGARMLMTLAMELARCGGGYGLVTICGGVGEAESAVIRVG